MAVQEGDGSTLPLERHGWIWILDGAHSNGGSLPLLRAESAEQGNDGGAVLLLLASLLLPTSAVQSNEDD